MVVRWPQILALEEVMKSILKLLLFTVGVLVLVVAVIGSGTIIVEALDGYEEPRSAISEGEEAKGEH